MPLGLGQLVAEHRADRAVDVGDAGAKSNRCPIVQGLTALHDQLLIERLVQPVILA
jgi:hypothetical protein